MLMCLLFALLMTNLLYPFKICGSSQAPGNTVISKPVAPSTIIHQGCPAPTSLPATTTLHRPPVLQVAEPEKSSPPLAMRLGMFQILLNIFHPLNQQFQQN